MTDHPNGGCAMGFRPSRWRQLCHWLGFVYHLDDRPANALMAKEGWVQTDCRLRFGLADRLRLLVCHELFVRVTVSSSAPPADVDSRMDWHIRPPGWE